MNLDTITSHYQAHYSNLVKKFTRAAGTQWDAEDVVQTAYERALRFYENTDVREFGAWFAIILRNALIDHINEGRGIQTEELEEYHHPAVSDIPPLELKKSLQVWIAAEPFEEQPILELYFLHGYSAVDIYRHNNFSYPHTRKLIQRFREKLKKRM